MRQTVEQEASVNCGPVPHAKPSSVFGLCDVIPGPVVDWAGEVCALLHPSPPETPNHCIEFG